LRYLLVTKRDLDELRVGAASDASNSDEAEALSRTVRGWRRWRMIVLRAAAPVLAWFALGLVLFGTQRDTDYDLQLIVSGAVQAGELLPMRALLYENLRGLEGPRLIARDLNVRLSDRRGRIYASTRLVPARAGYSDIEGSLRIPPNLVGVFQLRASAELEALRIEVETQVRVGEAQRASVFGRPLRALQQFSEGPLQAEAGAIAPSSLRVRVAGGACVPEEDCRLLVHVGAPAAAVWIEGNSTLTPSAAAAQPSAETAGVLQLSVVTHGPEAQLWLRANRGGVRVAQRSVRLPVALGAARLRLADTLWRAPALPQLTLLGGEGGCIVDAFRDGTWLRTGSAASCSHERPPPFAALPAGLYRIQARRDPFASSTSGVALAYVAGGESKSQALRELARRALESDPSDRFARESLEIDEAAQPDAASFGYLASLLEAGVIELPRAVSGYAATLDRLARTQAKLRWLSIIALALGALSLALSVGRSGLRAAARADAILLDAGQSGPVRRRARVRTILSLVLSVLSLLLVFLVLGAYVVVRSAP
jgi:hypothetical protein